MIVRMTYAVVMMRTLSLALALAAATACSQQPGDTAAVSGDTLALAAATAAPTTPAESNAANNAGDIPDTQVFVTFAGRGYSVLVPEGWSRTQRGSAVTFASNANSETIDVHRAGVNYDLRTRYHAAGVILLKKHAALGTDPATLITFRSQSEPSPVTGKRIELENELYTSSRHGLTAMLLLSAPVGADNADQWQKIAKSFRWK